MTYDEHIDCDRQLREAEDKIIKLRADNERLQRAIESFGKNPAGFDWAVLDRIDVLESALEKIANTPLGRNTIAIVEQALKKPE